MSGPASTQRRSVRAPAKVNLFLRVNGARPDGFHDLETLVVPISLADRLDVYADADPAMRTLSVSLDVTGPPALTEAVPRDESNLVLMAAGALAARCGVHGFAEITLEKLVPSGAGLGGGSADAAAALAVLNELWRCGLGSGELREIGASVGSDVPALMMGGPTLAAGRGERVRAVPCPALDLILVTFPFEVSTPDAFAWWDQEGATGPDPSGLLDAIGASADAATIAPLLFNDMEGPVIRRRPEVAEAKAILLGGGAVGAVMSGSGPSVVGLLPGGPARLSPEAGRALASLSGRRPSSVHALGRPAP